MNGKTIAIITHVPLIGWLIGWIINMETKEEFASFYNRQLLGINLLWIICAMAPVVGWILSLGVFVLWIISLVGAAQGEKKVVPYLGKYFQDWFKSM